MFCKYCGKEMGEDEVYCAYCGRQIKAAKKEPVREEKAPETHKPKAFGTMFGSGVFLVLTLLLSFYILLRLIAAGSTLTILLTIPTIVICVGCWAVFVQAQQDRQTAGALSVLGGGLMAQMLALLAYGVVFAILAAVSFIQFLNIEIGIDINLFNLHITTVGKAFADYYGNILILLIVICTLIAVWGLVFVRMLGSFRWSVRFAKNDLSGSGAAPKNPVRVAGLTGCVVFAAAGSAVKLFFANGIYTLFCFLLYPGQTLADGAADRLFPGSWNASSKEILESLVSYFRQRSGIGNETTDAIRNFFLSSLGSGETGGALSGMSILAAVLLLAVLVCVIVLLVRHGKACFAHRKK